MTVRSRAVVTGLLVLAAAVPAGCGGGGRSSAPAHPVAAHWAPAVHVPAVIDLTGPRADGRFTVAAAGRLSLLAAPPGAAGGVTPFARDAGGYATARGGEPYLALSTGRAVPGAGCTFPADTVYAIEPAGTPGVIGVDAQGRARRVATLSGVRPNGIAFDTVGRFGYRLLVTAAAGKHAAVYAIDCADRVRRVARQAPIVEGGLEVAPAGFGGFGGDLVAPDEKSGRIWAIGPDGKARQVARSPLPHGGDIGPESAAFVPAGITGDWAAYVADRRSPGNAHPGTDSVLRLPGAALAAAGVRPGDLLVASEGGGQTLAVRCARTCTVRHVADGPAPAHVEGHIIVAAA
ncbi:MAG: hypothetical protein ACJ73S_27130 [Mycobacteriales bacterium]